MHRQLAAEYAVTPNITDIIKLPPTTDPIATPTQRYHSSTPVTDADYGADSLGDIEGNQWWAWPTTTAYSYAKRAWGCNS